MKRSDVVKMKYSRREKARVDLKGFTAHDDRKKFIESWVLSQPASLSIAGMRVVASFGRDPALGASATLLLRHTPQLLDLKSLISFPVQYLQSSKILDMSIWT